MKNIIFYAREYNHLDQITPIIDVLMKKNQYKVIILLGEQDYNYEIDKNLLYIKNNYSNINIYHLYKIYLKDTRFMKCIYNFYYKIAKKRDIKKNIKLKQIYRFSASSLSRVLKRYKLNNPIKFNLILMELGFNPYDTILITDFGGDELYEQILIQAQNLQLVVVGIVHGLNVHTNKILLTNQFSLQEKSAKSKFKYLNYLDYMIIYCDLGYQHMLSQIGHDNTKKIVKLPTLRYTKFWIEKKVKIEDKFFTDNDAKVKIVYMVTSENYNMWIEEEYRTLKMLSSLKGIVVVIKPHPRTLKTVYKLRELQSDNFIIVDNSISSSSLINWCNIVMVSSSSILVECIAKRKAIMYMKYLHCNSINLEKYNSLIYEINTRDDVLQTLDIFISDLSYSKLDINELQAYLYDYVLDNNFDENAKKYLDFFQNIFDKKGVNAKK